jgi:hypothetical protein
MLEDQGHDHTGSNSRRLPRNASAATVASGRPHSGERQASRQRGPQAKGQEQRRRPTQGKTYLPIASG